MPAGEAVITDTPAKPPSNLVAHARRELKRIGEKPDTINWCLSVIRALTARRGLVSTRDGMAAFVADGHSCGSLLHAASVLERLLRYEALSELTTDQAEWEDRSEIGEQPLWRNTRDSRAISHDGGITYWMVHEADAAGGSDAAPLHRSTPV